MATLYKALTDTVAIEKTLESYLCPLQMFFELTRNGWSAGAFKILKHDLNVKRIFLAKLTVEYFRGISASLKRPASLHNDSVAGTAEATTGTTLNVKQVHDKSREEMQTWEDMLSIPLFVIGVVYAIVLNVRRTLVKLTDARK
ncbi:MAG: hypothetical protein HQL05_06990 [Nitrospirae bacterium]|uniref:hypothetical protein n=1 Tax=Candidatus Magnetobacterium casense TaxID=1455061 RepID=UPI000591034F|nr:hypothetical protein [Candidatus Magnetobacterium casensis]MBF0337565.1 hypothetical protein [Nitrospirota bacterium]